MSTSVPLSSFTLRRPVQFYEVDSAGIVHFSNYPRYMEEAEHAMWRAVGLSIAPGSASQSGVSQSGASQSGAPHGGAEVGYPRVAITCDYKAPLRFEDEAEIELRVTAMTRSTIRYACTVRCDATVMAQMTMTIVCIRKQADGSMVSTPLPDEVRERFALASTA